MLDLLLNSEGVGRQLTYAWMPAHAAITTSIVVSYCENRFKPSSDIQQSINCISYLWAAEGTPPEAFEKSQP